MRDNSKRMRIITIEEGVYESLTSESINSMVVRVRVVRAKHTQHNIRSLEDVYIKSVNTRSAQQCKVYLY